MIHMSLSLLFYSLTVLDFVVQRAVGFVIARHEIRPSSSRPNPYYLLPPSLTTAIEVFDGSQIVDPVVVSNVFWANLQGRLISVLLGQVLATAVFAILATLATKQIGKLSDYVSKNMFPNQEPKFRKLPERASNIGQPNLAKLVVCILIDLIGTSSELLPIVGEISDIAWAPIAALALRSLYGSNVVFALEFAEEILPFTDILPLATICWVVDTFFQDSQIAKLLSIGSYGPVNGSDQTTAIDVADDLPKRKQ